ncbi:uncharacterized protein LOC144173139 [Haemaphysalis longicornis]
MRICGYFGVTINPVATVEQYPISRIEDPWTVLAGADVSRVCHHCLLRCLKVGTQCRPPRLAGIPRDPREPRMFTGNADEDVEEWLRHYRRVSRYNRWDAAAQLANVVFSLDETALTWFDNNESKFTTWDRFVEEISSRFGDSVAKKKLAEQTLLHRAQVPGETCTTYIEEVLKLCRLVDPQMSEDDKVGHLLKGIAEDVYNFLIGREKLESASDVVQHIRTFEALKKRRITPKFGRLANVTTVASVDLQPPADFAEMIRRIVREELLRQEESRHYTDSVRIRDSYVLPDVQANTLSPSSVPFRDASFMTRTHSPQRSHVHQSARNSRDVEWLSQRSQRTTYDQRPRRPTFEPRSDDVYEEYFPDRLAPRVLAAMRLAPMLACEQQVLMAIEVTPHCFLILTERGSAREKSS